MPEKQKLMGKWKAKHFKYIKAGPEEEERKS